MNTEQTQPVDQGPATGFCVWHPDAETGLSCSQCGRSICTQCMVQAPVGIRCRECGRAVRTPTYDVQRIHFLKGFAVAALTGFGGGVAWWIFTEFAAILFQGRVSVLLASLPAVAVGWVVGELTSRAINKKRSILVSLACGIAVVLAYTVNLIFVSSRMQPYFDLWTLLFLAMGVWIAMGKLR